MTYMLIPTAVDRLDVITSSYAFNTFKKADGADFDDTYVSVAIATDDVTGLQLDGNLVTDSFTDVGLSGYSVITISLSHGFHTLTHVCSRPFTGFVHSYMNNKQQTAGTGLPSWNSNYVNPGYCVVTTTQQPQPTTTRAVSTAKKTTAVATTSAPSPTTTVPGQTTHTPATSSPVPATTTGTVAQ